jgi:shikimate dehydrogenase
LDILPVDGRPISQSTSKADLYAKRLPLYKAFADLEADNNGAVEDTVKSILKALGYRS